MTRCYLVGTIHIRQVNESRLNVPVDMALLEGVYPGRISLADWLLYMPVLLFYYIWIFILDHMKTDEGSTKKFLKTRNIKYETVDLTMEELFGMHREDIFFTAIWYVSIGCMLLDTPYRYVPFIASWLLIIFHWVVATQKDRDRGLVNRIAELIRGGKNVLVVRGRGHTGWIAQQLKKRGIEYEIISAY